MRSVQAPLLNLVLTVWMTFGQLLLMENVNVHGHQKNQIQEEIATPVMQWDVPLVWRDLPPIVTSVKMKLTHSVDINVTALMAKYSMKMENATLVM